MWKLVHGTQIRKVFKRKTVLQTTTISQDTCQKSFSPALNMFTMFNVQSEAYLLFALAPMSFSLPIHSLTFLFSPSLFIFTVYYITGGKSHRVCSGALCMDIGYVSIQYLQIRKFFWILNAQISPHKKDIKRTSMLYTLRKRFLSHCEYKNEL